MPPEFSERLITKRNIGRGQKDIHEKSKDYLRKSYENACWVAEKYNWIKVECVQNNEIKSIAEIHEYVYSLLKDILRVKG